MQSVSSIHAGSSEKDILRGLLESGSASAMRVALFVVGGRGRMAVRKHYGNTRAASGDDFSKAVIRSLAEDEASVPGANSKR